VLVASDALARARALLTGTGIGHVIVDEGKD
jgi:hypothetical protein